MLRQNFAASWHGPSRSYDFRLRRRDGFEVWVNIAANLLFDQDGAFLGVLDVHRYKRTQRAEDAQKAIEKQLALLFEASSALLASPESTRRPKNSGALSFVMAESPRRFRKPTWRLAEELARRAATVVENARLYAESKKGDEALGRPNEELQRANEDLNQFAYSASHDLQEPLRMVAVFSQLLARKYSRQLDAEGQKYVGFTLQGARRMEMLLKDLLAYTQVVNYAAEELALVDANAIFEKALSNLGTSIREAGAVVTRGELPALRIQEIHLLQLFQNLIGNAIKYRSETAINVRVTCEPQGEFWKICVQDNGIGIAPAYASHIFGIFKRLHNSDKYAGTGIGLAICQKIVERYGGRIWVESEEGHGSTFCFTIPGGSGSVRAQSADR